MAHHASGDAINKAITTNFKKSFDSSVVMLVTEAPSTLRTPISLMRFSAMYVAKPNKPKHEIKMVRPANNAAKVAVRFSSLNFFAYSSSTNVYSNGYAGLY